MRRIIFARQARNDFVDIWKYLHPNSSQAAVRVMDEIEEAIRTLAVMPGRGHRHADIPDPRYRVWRVYSYLIAYRFTPKSISIARIVQGARNLGPLFRKRR